MRKKRTPKAGTRKGEALVRGPLFVVTMSCAALSVVLLLAAGLALARRRWLGSVAGLALALVLLTLAALAAALSLGTQGYRALTREETAALITLEPTGPQTVTARFRFPDGREAVFEVAGDELYIDAHILKWHPLANLIGLHTGYELDRVAGRYTSLEDERSKPRTVFPLAHPKPVNLFALAQRYPVLAPLVDAQYGSATFTPVPQPTHLQLQVSTTGLLLRKVGDGRP
jgi:hypothetical protein